MISSEFHIFIWVNLSTETEIPAQEQVVTNKFNEKGDTPFTPNNFTPNEMFAH